MTETFWCLEGWIGGHGLPRGCSRVVWAVRQWEMGGFGSAGAGMSGFSRYDAGRVRWVLETEAGTEGNALWKCDEQKKVYVITVVGPKMDSEGEISECDAIEVRDTRGTTAKMKCAKDAVY